MSNLFVIIHIYENYDKAIAFPVLDYDGPLSEAGDTTEKYHALKAMITSYASENSSKSLSNILIN